jgi:class 3 adenylate cyclase
MEPSSTEHRFLSVMFCDMVDSTGHQYRMEPEQFAQLLTTYRGLVFEIVRRHGGHVARVIGDGVLAYFGWPRAGGHDAQAAVSAGLEIGAAIARLGRDQRPQTPVAVAVRVAIETGWVLVGTIGAADGRDDAEAEAGGVVGHAPNVAARLQRLALPNGVVAGEVTLSLIGDRFEIEAVDTSDIPLPAKVAAARVLGRAAAADVLERLGGGSSVLVGREGPAAEMLQCWHRARQGDGQVVLLSGDAGIGKSRLAASLVTSVRAEAEVIAMLCAAATTNSAFAPLAEPLRHRMGLAADATPQAVQAAARELVQGYDIPGDAEAVAAVLGVAPTQAAPAELRRATFAALLAFATRLAADRPLILVAEDLHWADASTLELLGRLIEQIGQHRIMLLATHRSGWIPPWPDAPRLCRIALAPLPPDAAARLVETVGAGLDPQLRAAIVERAEGIPFFIEEFARAMQRQGGAAPRLPGSIAQLMTARLDSIGPARDLVQVAAVVGREIDLALLGEVGHRPPDQLTQEIEQLQDIGIITRRGEGGTAVLTFRHALLADAAYEAMTGSRRKTLHRQVAMALQARQGRAAETEPEVLARHYALAGEPEVAQKLYRTAATNALATAAFAEAAAHARRAIELAHDCDGEAKHRGLMSAMVLLGESLSGTLGYASAEVRAAFEDASRVALAHGTAADLQPVLRGLTAYYQIRGPLHRAHELGRRAVQVARMAGDPLQLAEAERRWGWCRLCQGELDEARLLVESAMSRLERVRTERGEPVVDDTAVRGPGILALVAWLVDGREAALVIARGLPAEAERFPLPMTRIYGLGFASFVFQLVGDAETAHRLASQSGELARNRGNPYWQSLSDIVCGWAEVVGRRDSSGLARIRQGLRKYEESESVILYPYALMLMAEAEATLGSEEAALAFLNQALQVAGDVGALFYVPLLQLARGRILLRQDPDAGRAALSAARSEAIRQGALALVARIELLASLPSAPAPPGAG